MSHRPEALGVEVQFILEFEIKSSTGSDRHKKTINDI